MAKFVGKSFKRVEDPRFLQGQGKYVSNLQRPGMAYVAIARSPHAHADIKGIDASAALELDGVVAVFTGQDLIDGGVGQLPCGWVVPDCKIPERWPVVPDRARHVGDAVAVVVADNPYVAEDALELIEVDYEPLPVSMGARATTEYRAQQIHSEIPNNTAYSWALGDEDGMRRAFVEAAHVVELDLINQRLIPNAMEPRACMAEWDDTMEEMTVWTTSQNPHPIRLLLSGFTLGIPENKLRVISPDVGGGFGSKIFHYPEEIIVPWVARAINRPAKWVATRSESFMTDSQGRDHVTNVRMAMDATGTITGLHVQTWADQGAYLSTFAPLIPTALSITLFSGLYKIPGIWGEMKGTLTNTVPVDAYRGAGRPEASYLLERIVEKGAQKMGMDPIAFRRHNLIPADEFPYQTPVAFQYDSGNYQGLFDKLEEISGYGDLREEQKSKRAEGKLWGVGVSGCIEASGPAPSAVAGSLGSAVGFWESGTVRVHPTGKVTALTGSHAHGQGHETTFAQILADELNIPLEDIEVVHGDTGRVPFGMGTYGSRSAAVGGSALVRSATRVREKMTKIAAHQMESRPEDVYFDDETGNIRVQGATDEGMSFFEVALAAYTAHDLPPDIEPGLEETAFFDPSNFTFPNSAHIAVVSIDRETGEVTLEKYFGVDDVGKVINPMIVDGQLVGGVAQGVGQALWEHGIYGEDGQLLTGSMMDYAMPRADRFPQIETDRIETPSPTNPLGVKGAGEMGTIAATVTVANAVVDALAPLGVDHVEMPFTAERIWQTIQAHS